MGIVERLAANQASADHIGMAIQMLGRGMDDPVRAKVEGTLIERRRHGVVDNHRRAHAMRLLQRMRRP